MASLTEVSFYTRKIIKYGFVGILVVISLKTIISASIAFWKKIHPPAPPPPTVAFGKLPSIMFPTQEKINDLQYKIETPDGGFPSLGDRAKVFYMPYQRPNLLALERAKQEALLMGFKNEPKALSEKKYQWTSQILNNLTLTMDIFTGSFIYNYNWSMDPSIMLDKDLPGIEQAKAEVKNFLQKIDVSEEDLIEGRIEVNYLKVNGRDLVPSVSPSEAQFAQIEMFRNNIDNLPVLTFNPQKGIISFLISSSKNYEKRYIKVENNYFPAKYDSSATYPIKTASAAFQELQNNNAFIASFNSTSSKVTIRRIYLAYFDSVEPQSYLQPIIVFEGDEGFFAYIKAVSNEWIL